MMWFRAKVQEAIEDLRPGVPYAQVRVRAVPTRLRSLTPSED
jgi:hypothetical protein